MSPAALAKAAGVDPATVYRIERGEVKKPQAKTIADLQKVLQIGPFAHPPEETQTAGEMKNHELAARYWELVNELSQVGAEMARRLPPGQDEPPRRPKSRPPLSEFVGPGDDAWRGDTAEGTG